MGDENLGERCVGITVHGVSSLRLLPSNHGTDMSENKNPPAVKPGDQSKMLSTDDEHSVSAPPDPQATKKIFRWQVAVRAWAKVALQFVTDDMWELALLNHIQDVLGREEFKAREMLFYFRHDTDKPHQVKKNGKQIVFNKHMGRSVLLKSATFNKLESELIGALQLAARAQQINEPFTGRLWMMAHFYFPRDRYYAKTGQISETLPDLSNLLELPQDCMQPPKVVKSGQKKGRTVRQGAGILSNDSHIDSLDGCRRIPWDRSTYRLEIFLMRYGGHGGSKGN